MLLTIRKVPDDLVEKAKQHTGKNSGSQAFIASVEKMISQTQRIQVLETEVTLLRDELRRRKLVLNQLSSLCAQVAEISAEKQ